MYSGIEFPQSLRLAHIGIILVVFLILTLAFSDSRAATYHVAQTGSDQSSGKSWESAWRTLKHAGNNARPGDTVIIRKGPNAYQYLPVANSGTQSHPIIFKGESDTDLPVITGARQVTGWKQAKYPGVWVAPSETRPNILLEDGNLLPRSSSPTCSDGGWFWEKKKLFYRPGDKLPSQHKVWKHTAAGGAVIRSKSWVELRNLHFWFGGGAGISIKNGHHIQISNVRVEWHWRGIDISHDSTYNVVDKCAISNNREGVYLSFRASYNTVRNCAVTRNGNLPWVKGDRAGIAIGIKGPNVGNLIENNEISYNGGSYSDPGLIAFEAPHTIIKNNNVHNNYGNGLYVTIESHGSRVIDNRVALNGIPATQAGNKGIAGLSVRSSRAVWVENNQVIDNHVSRDSRWSGTLRGPKGGLDVQGLPGQDMTNLVFRNNIVTGTVGGPDIYINPKPNLRGLEIVPRQQAPSWYSPEH